MKICPDGTYPDANNKCLNCDQKCKTCFGPTSAECNSCLSGYYLEKTTCDSNCSSIYLFADDKN